MDDPNTTQPAPEATPLKPLGKRAQKRLDKKRAEDARRAREYRERKHGREAEAAKTIADAEQAKISAATEALNEKAAKSIISSEWGVVREHLIDTVYKWGKRAAEQRRIPATTFYWTNGPIATLATIKAGEPQPLQKCGDEKVVVGEVTYRKEIFALYHFVEAWRADAVPTFEAYLAERRSCKMDGTINRGNRYFGKDFHEKPHGRWDDMFVRWNPDLLKPDYTQDDVKKWLSSQSEFKRRLLIACRNSYKSNFSLVYLVGAVLCNPDIRLLFVSETKPLSKSFLAGFRQFFEVSNPNEPRRFVRLFPEHCVPVGDGSSLEFQSPMRILGLFQPTANSTSMESGGWAGSRSDYTLFSDSISSNTVGTEDQIQKSVVNTDAILELTEVGGYVHWEGTPWHENDLYAQIMARNERSPEKNLLMIVDPAWTVKESKKGKDIFSLVEEDVDLLFPARLTWKFLQGKLRDGDPRARTFRMQSLCQFLPEVEEEDRLQFDKDALLRNVLPAELIPPSTDAVYGAGDLGFSRSRYADPSAFTVFKVVESKLYVLDQIAGNWRDSEKAKEIVAMQRKYPQIRCWVIEKYPSYERLDEDIKMEAMKHGILVPVMWVNPTHRGDDKFRRIKSIETYVAQGRIKFRAGAYTADLFSELEKLDGSGPKRRSSTIKDDRGDSLGIGILYFMPSPDDEDAAARIEFMEKQEEKERRIRQYNAMFGGDFVPTQTPIAEVPQVNYDDNPIYKALKPLNQGRLQTEKVHGFGYMREIKTDLKR